MENKVIEEQIISLETAKLANNKGFNVEGNSFYNRGSNYKLQNDSIIRIGDDLIYEAPTQSLLQKWLRDKFDIHLQIVICLWSIRKYQYIIHSETCHKKSSQYLDGAIFGSYEEVLEFGLKECLKLIK